MGLLAGAASMLKVSVSGIIKIQCCGEDKSRNLLLYVLFLNCNGQGIGMLQCNGYPKHYCFA